MTQIITLKQIEQWDTAREFNKILEVMDKHYLNYQRILDHNAATFGLYGLLNILEDEPSQLRIKEIGEKHQKYLDEMKRYGIRELYPETDVLVEERKPNRFGFIQTELSGEKIQELFINDN